LSTQNPQPQVTTGLPRWTVPSATTEGTDYTVTVNEHGERVCNCEANGYPKTRGKCWHLKAVASGLAGKPRIRVSQSSGVRVQASAPAPLPTVRRARTSAEGLAYASSLDI
jgi:hypothetical protein